MIELSFAVDDAGGSIYQLDNLCFSGLEDTGSLFGYKFLC